MLAAILALGLLILPQLPAERACSYRGPLPDASCTPGATDSRVTQDNIADTICVSGYSARMRPPAAVTNRWKAAVMRWYGVNDPSGRYEGDHLISIELGGDPGATQDGLRWLPTNWADNFWPQPWLTVDQPGAHRKDRLENRLHRLVCDGELPLAEAQQAIATDWIAAYDRYISGLEPIHPENDPEETGT